MNTLLKSIVMSKNVILMSFFLCWFSIFPCLMSKVKTKLNLFSGFEFNRLSCFLLLRPFLIASDISCPSYHTLFYIATRGSHQNVKQYKRPSVDWITLRVHDVGKNLAQIFFIVINPILVSK